MCNPRPKHIKAIIFDIGGVVVGSPIAGVQVYEQTHGLPHNYLNVGITARGRDGAFQKFERSELDLYSFYEQFGAQLSDTKQLNEWYSTFCLSRGLEVPANLPTAHHVDGRELFGIMMRQSVNADQRVVKAIQTLRKSGRFKVAALTNNFAPPTSSSVSTPSTVGRRQAPTLDEELAHLGLDKEASQIRSLFDAYYESSVVGARKPEAAFYEHALHDLGVHPEETVFLDDIGPNLKAAQKMGIRTIRVGLDSSLPALEELERHTNCKLIDDEDRKAERARLAASKSSRPHKM